jgi:transcriptional regulator with XRE-family HTH domain
MARDGLSTFGGLLRRHRLAAGLTEEALAEQAGLSARDIADLERGVRRYPYPATVDRLAAALRLDEHDRLELQSMRRRSARSDEAHAALGDTIPLVGRRAEWRQLQQVWQDAVDSRPQCVVIEGEAGIGKSHLANELLAWAARKGTRTAHARAYAAEGRLSYAPIVDWLRSAALRSNLDQLDAPSLGLVGQLMPELLSDRPDLADRTLAQQHHRHTVVSSPGARRGQHAPASAPGA